MLCYRPILRGEDLRVRLQGLEYMNDDPSAVDVLYAKIQPGDQAERSRVITFKVVLIINKNFNIVFECEYLIIYKNHQNSTSLSSKIKEIQNIILGLSIFSIYGQWTKDGLKEKHPGVYDAIYFFRLQILADRLVDRFSMTGFMQQEYSRVKLHVTVMNTLMRRDPTSIPGERPPEGKRGNKERESFDAMNLMKVMLYLSL